MNKSQLNVFGKVLKTCSDDPLTGFFRDGCSKGNDLITPREEFNFPGLMDGDRWCLCVDRWIEAYQNECAPRLVLEATNVDVLKKIDIEILKKFALDIN